MGPYADNISKLSLDELLQNLKNIKEAIKNTKDRIERTKRRIAINCLDAKNGHLRSGPRIGPHQPLRAISKSLSDRCFGCLYDCCSGSSSPKLQLLLGREKWQSADIRLAVISFYASDELRISSDVVSQPSSESHLPSRFICSISSEAASQIAFKA